MRAAGHIVLALEGKGARHRHLSGRRRRSRHRSWRSRDWRRLSRNRRRRALVVRGWRRRRGTSVSRLRRGIVLVSRVGCRRTRCGTWRGLILFLAPPNDPQKPHGSGANQERSHAESPSEVHSLVEGDRNRQRRCCCSGRRGTPSFGSHRLLHTRRASHAKRLAVHRTARDSVADPFRSPFGANCCTRGANCCTRGPNCRTGGAKCSARPAEWSDTAIDGR
jgi:hypothetical protein